MATKKVFTNLAFQGSAELQNPRLHPLSSEPTNVGAGQLYYDDSAQKKYLRLSTASDTFVNIPTSTSGTSTTAFDLGGYLNFSATGREPFTVASNTKVANLNADLLDGYDTSTTAVANKIPVYGTNGVLKVGPPVAAEDATPRSYVDNAIQGLDHKESVIATTSGDITLTGLSAQSNLDAAGNGSVTDGQRILVKNQDPATENGIYIARSGGWELASDSTYGSNIVPGEGKFTGTNGDTPSGYTAVAATAVIASDKLKVTSGGSGNGYAVTGVNTVIGETYQVSVDYTDDTGASALIWVGTSVGGNESAIKTFSSTGTYTTSFRATAETHYIRIGANEATGNLAYIFDNLKCRKTDLTDGAFVFVEEGTYANSSWVLGGDGVTWTQFSGAGQIDVESNGATAAPLTKAGNTINFAYNTDRFALNSNALDIKADGILSTHIADGQIVPAQLVNTSSFTMGGLTVNGTIGLNTSSPSHAFQTDVANGNANFIGIRQASQILWSTGLKASDTNLYFRSGNAGQEVDHVTFGIDGQVGIGADATNPSGTMHVSTARYGNEEVINGDFESANNGEWILNGWSFGSGVATATAAAQSLKQSNVFDVSKTYQVSFDYNRTDSTSDTLTVSYHDGSSYVDITTVSDDNGTKTVTFTVGSNIHSEKAIYFRAGGGTDGWTGTLNNVSVKEDLLSTSANLSVNSAADDLVIANNDHGGLSIITPVDKKGIIFFGDKNDNDRGGIKYDHAENNSVATDERMEFSVNGDNKALTLHSDLSAKFEGGVGVGVVGAVPTNAVGGLLTVKAAATGTYGIAALQSADASKKTWGAYEDSSGNGFNYIFNSSGLVKVALGSTGTSYFNGGNVAIGGATANQTLTIVNTSTGDWDKGLGFRLGTTDTAKIIVDSDGLKFRTFVSGDNFYFRNSANNTTLSIEDSGVLNQSGNSIVNSATVAGLQDGACYDFDGANTNHIALPTAAYDGVVGDRITVAAWIKRTSDSGVFDGIVSVDGLVNQAEGFALLIDGTNDKLFWQYDSPTGAAQIDSNNSGGQVLALNKWYHVVGIWDGSNLKTYVNGVLDRTQSGAGKALSGTNKTIVIGNQGTNSSSYFRGQIRDVKIFPSALDAADVRKLYSGENPKKNLNVELIANGDFSDSIGSEWAGSTDATLTQNNGQLTITSSGSNYGAAYAPISITEGKRYLLTFDMVDTNANSYIRVGTIDATNKTQSSQVSSNILSDAVVADGTTVRTVFVASSSQASDGYLAFGGRNDMTTLVLDNVSLVEVETLVDFTPQSASSTQWRNEAIPSLYHGTVNNATLSQGNSYWNNIKQDGTATTIDGSLEIQTASGGELNFDRNGNSGVAIQLKNNGDIASGTLKLAGGSGVTLFTNATEALSTAGGNVKVAAKLGVGGVAATGDYSILCHGGSVFEDTMRFGDENGSKGFLGWNNIDSSPAQPGAHNHFRIGASKNATNAGISFITRNNADVDAGVITREGYWGIGGTTADELLHIQSATDANAYLKFTTGNTGTGANNGCWVGWDESSDLFQIFSKEARDFRIGTNTVERFRIKSDGTQDHKSNSIVNSASIAGLQDGGACYDFNDTDSYIELASSGIGIFDKQAFTISTWVKLKSGRTNDSVIFSYDYTSHAIPYYATHFRVDVNGKIYYYWNNGSNYQGITSGNDALTDDTWHHVVVNYKSGSQKIYVDGVEQASATNTDTITYYAQEVWIGKGNYSGGELDGSVRDFKYIQSWLDAADIRKLYSGENPKKNNNANLLYGVAETISNTTWFATSATHTWTHGSGVISINGQQGGHRFLNPQTTVTSEGQVVKVRFEVVDITAGTLNLSYSTGPATSGASVSYGDSNGFYEFVNVVTGNNLVYFRAESDFAGSIRNISFEVIDTLVDLTPQSASSTKWRNEALLGFYDGTVNNATLSQGNSYWNNIKQSERNITLNGHFTNDANHNNYRVGIKNDDPQETLHIGDEGLNRHGIVRIAGFANNEYWNVEPGTNTLNFKDWDGTSQLALNGSTDSVKVVGKLGVGGEASSCQLRVAGTSEFENTIFLGDHQGYRGLISWSGDFDSGVGSAHSHMVLAGSNTAANAGIQFKTRTGSAHVEAGVISAQGYWGLGVTAPSAPLHVRKNISSGGSGANTILRLGAIDLPEGLDLQAGDGTRLLFEVPNLDASKIGAAIDAVKEQANDSYSETALVFSTTQNDETLDEAFRIKSDGTQDHKANRIVNSQTVNDSWRTSEPSLRFDGTNDYVALGSVIDHGTSDFSYAAWVKIDTFSGSPGIISNRASSGTNVGCELRLAANNGIQVFLDFGSNTASVTKEGLVTGKWYHVAATIDRDGYANLYIDGVSEGTPAGISSLSSTSLTSGAEVRIGRNEATTYLDGEIKDVRIHNRALDVDEIKGLYNGESTPFVYADSAGNVTPSTANSDASVWSKNSDATLTYDTDHMELANNTAAHGAYLTPANMGITATVGKRYRISAKLKNGTASGVSVRLQAYPLTGDGLVDHTTTSSYVEVSTEFTATAAFTQVGVWPLSDLNNSNIEFKDFKFEEVGEIAAYTPKTIDAQHSQSAKHKWLDATSNNNHGSINGCTPVGDNDHRGILRVHSNSDAGSAYAHQHLNGTINIGSHNNYQGRIDYNATGGTEFLIDNSYNSNSAKTQFGMKTAGNRLPVLELVGDGSVKATGAATSAVAPTLKQVARVHTDSITFGNNNHVAFRIEHMLGTKYVTVSVCENSTSTHSQNAAHVETEVRIGDWVGATSGALTTQQSSSDEKYVTIIFASRDNPTDQNKAFKVTVIG